MSDAHGQSAPLTGSIRLRECDDDDDWPSSAETAVGSKQYSPQYNPHKRHAAARAAASAARAQAEAAREHERAVAAALASTRAAYAEAQQSELASKTVHDAAMAMWRAAQQAADEASQAADKEAADAAEKAAIAAAAAEKAVAARSRADEAKAQASAGAAREREAAATRCAAGAAVSAAASAHQAAQQEASNARVTASAAAEKASLAEEEADQAADVAAAESAERENALNGQRLFKLRFALQAAKLPADSEQRVVSAFLSAPAGQELEAVDAAASQQGLGWPKLAVAHAPASKMLLYQVSVSLRDGPEEEYVVTCSGPVANGSNVLQRVLGEDNVLRVSFDDYARQPQLAKKDFMRREVSLLADGLNVAQRTFKAFSFKDDKTGFYFFVAVPGRSDVAVGQGEPGLGLVEWTTVGEARSLLADFENVQVRRPWSRSPGLSSLRAAVAPAPRLVGCTLCTGHSETPLMFLPAPTDDPEIRDATSPRQLADVLNGAGAQANGRSDGTH